MLAPRCIAVTAVIVHEFRADVQLPRHVGQELRRRGCPGFQWPSGKTQMAELDGKSQPVMIPPVLADYLEVLVG